jgi:hypothetical protein
MRDPLPDGASVVGEFFTEARIGALNAELIRRDIAAEQIIMVLPVDAQIMVNPTPRSSRCCTGSAESLRFTTDSGGADAPLAFFLPLLRSTLVPNAVIRRSQ